MNKIPLHVKSVLNPVATPQICRVLHLDMIIFAVVAIFLLTLFFSGYFQFKIFGYEIKDQAVFFNSYHFHGSLILSVIASLLVGGYFFIQPSPTYSIRRGRELLIGKDAIRFLKRKLNYELKSQDEAAQLHPAIPPFSRDQLTKGILISGAIGSGKTQALLYLMSKALNHRCILFDLKGDFTSLLQRMILLAPHDSRSHQWWVSKDVATRADAQLFASLVIVESSDPMWSNAARQILVALIVELQRTKSGKWTFRDLACLARKSEEELSEIIKRNSPEAAATAENITSKTGASIRITLASYLSPIFDLARAWPKFEKGKMFSFKNYLDPSKDPENPPAVVIQGSGKHKQLMEAFSGSAIGLAVSKIADPSYSESKERQIYFFLDEFTQLGRIDPLIILVEVGRSKGVCSIFGVQDLAQIEKVYDRETAQIITSTMSSQIVCRANPGETAERISESFGEQEFEFISVTHQADGSKNYQLQTQRQQVISPEDLSTLQTGKNGNEVILSMGGEKYLFLLKLPIFQVNEKRKPHIPAQWTFAKKTKKKKKKVVQKRKSVQAQQPKVIEADEVRQEEIVEEKSNDVQDAYLPSSFVFEEKTSDEIEPKNKDEQGAEIAADITKGAMIEAIDPTGVAALAKEVNEIANPTTSSAEKKSSNVVQSSQSTKKKKRKKKISKAAAKKLRQAIEIENE